MGVQTSVDDAIIVGPNGSRVEVIGNEVAPFQGAMQAEIRSRFQQAVLDGNAYTWASLDKTPDAGDTIFAVENNSSSHTLFIQKIIVSTDLDTEVVIFGATGVTVSGTTTVVGVNLNRASGRAAEATAVTDDTGNGEAASSWPIAFYHTQLTSEAMHLTIDVDGAIRLPNDVMIGIDLVVNCGFANATIWGWFEPNANANA